MALKIYSVNNKRIIPSNPLPVLETFEECVERLKQEFIGKEIMVEPDVLDVMKVNVWYIENNKLIKVEKSRLTK